MTEPVVGSGISVLTGQPYLSQAKHELRCCLQCQCEWTVRLVLKDLTRPGSPARDRPVIHWAHLNRENAYCSRCGQFGWTGPLRHWTDTFGLPLGQLTLTL